jgi:hypothetical protein
MILCCKPERDDSERKGKGATDSRTMKIPARSVNLNRFALRPTAALAGVQLRRPIRWQQQKT